MLRFALVLLAAGAGALIASSAQASGESERLTSRGLSSFHTERYEAALLDFEAAVGADPRDAEALYYRGVTRGRLGNMRGAATDLREVLRLRPGLRQAYLELGFALVQLGRYSEAAPFLERAQAFPELDGQASLLLGVSELRMGRDEMARGRFERAARLAPELELESRYYQGVVAYRSGDMAEAHRHLEHVIATAPSSPEAREARKLLDREAAPAGRPLDLYGSLAFQYDSNVVLAPSDDTSKADLAISDEADGRVAVRVGARYAPVQTDRLRLGVGYELSQSLHFDLTDFNLQDHRFSADLSVSEDGFDYGLSARYDFYRLDTDDFLGEVTTLPWLRLDFGDRGWTDLYYRFKSRNFVDREFELLRDSNNHALGISHTVARRYGGRDYRFGAGYRFDTDKADNPEGRIFEYDGHMLEASVACQLSSRLVADAVYAYKYEDYAGESGGRSDDEHHVILALARTITEQVALKLSYLARINQSNKVEFDYDRHIASLGVELRY